MLYYKYREKGNDMDKDIIICGICGNWGHLFEAFNVTAIGKHGGATLECKRCGAWLDFDWIEYLNVNDLMGDTDEYDWMAD